MGYKSLDSVYSSSKNVVIDNSVIMRWLVNDGSENDQYKSKVVLESINKGKINPIVPDLWVYEASNVLAFYVKKGLIEHKLAIKRFNMPFEFCGVITMNPNYIDLTNLAINFGLSSYDAAYLLLAHQLDCPLATLDKKLKQAVTHSNGKLFVF